MNFEDTAIFLRAKLSSTRLPRKHLLEVQGKPIIEHLIERIWKNTHIRPIVLCTTDEPEDEELVDIAIQHGIDFHRYEKGLVLQQYVNAAEKFGVTKIINIDCDDPLVDYKLIDETADIMNTTRAHYVTWEGYPLGCTPSGMSYYGLVYIANKYKEAIEHVFAYCENEPALKKLVIKENSQILSKPYIKDIRLTMDYEEDYQVIKAIYDGVYPNDKNIGFGNLMQFLDENQYLIQINSFRNEDFKANQKKQLEGKQNLFKDSDDWIMEAYRIVRVRGGQDKTVYVGMDDLYVQLKSMGFHQKRMGFKGTIDEFKATMLGFYDRHNMKDYCFAVGSGVRNECKKYGFGVGGKLMFYMQKLPTEQSEHETKNR